MADHAPEAAFCSICRGVLPFEPGAARRRTRCARCGTEYLRTDPAAAPRRASLRFIAYGATAGLMLSLQAAGGAALGSDHPLFSGWGGAAHATLLAALAIGCLGHAAVLWSRASRYERLAPHEWEEVARRLCVGMIRSDVERELSLRGWRPAKIRFVLDALRPASAGPASRRPASERAT